MSKKNFIDHHLPFSYQFTLCMFDDEPQKIWLFRDRYNNLPNYCTSNDIVTLQKITGTVIGQVTVPVMTLWHFNVITGTVIGKITVPVMTLWHFEKLPVR